MITSAANSAAEITPTVSARLSTISSVSPRVFISAPSTADWRHGRRITRAAISVPPNLPTIAIAHSARVIAISSPRPSSATLVRRPVYAKNSGSSSVRTKSSTRRVTSSLSPAWRGIAIPITNAPKITAIPIVSVAIADSSTPAKMTVIHVPGTRPASS